VLSARAVERRYGRRVALRPTDLDVRPGETVALVGPNGAGKSTLLALLAGVLPPSGGAVRRALPARTIGWAPQRPALYGHLSARENLELFARLAGHDRPAEAAARAAGALGLAAEPARAGRLSVGNQQRLNLALALLGDPEALLLDEPSASLDPAGRSTLWELLDEHRRRGRATVLATHSVEEAVRLADRALALVEGAVAREGPPAEVAAALEAP
jgi:ABC-2 type transport system ATP-binding protein